MIGSPPSECRGLYLEGWSRLAFEAGNVIADNRHRRLIANPAVKDSAKGSSRKRGHDEQPELADSPASRKKRRADTTGRVDRGIGDGNAY